MASNLTSCPPIGKHTIQRNDEERTLIVGRTLIRFTRTEYSLLLPLLSGLAVSDVQLAQASFAANKSPQITKAIEKHIDSMRSKLRLSGLNIHRVARYGYVLLAEASEETT